MILKLEIKLPILPYERENIMFYEKNLKLAKNNTCNNGFCNGIFPFYRFLANFQK